MTGNVNLGVGSSLVQLNALNGETQLTFTAVNNISRVTGSTLTFGQTSTNAAFASNPGDGASRIFLAGTTALVNGILPTWITVAGVDGDGLGGGFATYDSGLGVRQINYMNTTALSGLQASQNVLVGANFTIASSGVGAGAVAGTVNTLTMGNATLTFANANDTLVVAAGGINGANVNNPNIGGAVNQGKITTGAGQQELFIYKQNNTLTINSIITDNGTGPLNVILGSMSSGGGAITLTGNNTYTGITYINGINVNLNNNTGSPTIKGDIVVSGGTTNGTDALGIIGITFNNQSNQIASTASLTLNGGGRLNLNGFNQTIKNLTYTADGGSNGFNGPTVLTQSGTLTVAGTIKATNLLDPSVIPTASGTLSLTNATPVITVDANLTVPGQIGLALNTAISTANNNTTNVGFTKNGLGVLGFGAPTGDFGQLNVTQGGVAISASTAVIGSQINLNGSSTFLDTRGLSGVIGSLVGNGTLENTLQTTQGTLTMGLDNRNATFDGTITSPFASGQLNLVKIGTGAQTFTADSSATNSGTLTVDHGPTTGAVILKSATAKLGFSTYVLNTGGVINVDDSTNNVANRLGGRSINTAASGLSGDAGVCSHAPGQPRGRFHHLHRRLRRFAGKPGRCHHQWWPEHLQSRCGKRRLHCHPEQPHQRQQGRSADLECRHRCRARNRSAGHRARGCRSGEREN